MAFNSTTPQIVIDTQNYTLSKTILNIPQKIKTTIKDNILTLFENSRCWFPNGNKYEEVRNTHDLTFEIDSTEGIYVACMSFSGNQIMVRNINACVSGSGVTTVGGFAFNTDTNHINNYSSEGIEGGRYCAPFCIFKVDENGIASFIKDRKGRDIVFNGSGFIGHHIFVYPRIKVLVPDDINTDGGLKSYESETKSLLIKELSSNLFKIAYLDSSAGFIGLLRGYEEYENKTDIASPKPYILYYIKKENTAYTYDDGFLKVVRKKIIDFTYNGTTITEFTIEQPYDDCRYLLTDDCVKNDYPVNYTDLTSAPNVATYTAPAGGVCYVYTSDTGTDTETFYINDVMIFNVKQIGTSGKTTTIPVTFILNKGDVLTCNHSWGSLTFIPFN